MTTMKKALNYNFNLKKTKRPMIFHYWGGGAGRGGRDRRETQLLLHCLSHLEKLTRNMENQNQ